VSLTFHPGTEHLDRLGLEYVSTGNGSPQDYEVFKARKEHACGHSGPWSRRLTFPCEHPVIAPREVYCRTLQGFNDTEPLSMACAIAAGFFRPKGAAQ
jgi:hypothetical protein